MSLDVGSGTCPRGNVNIELYYPKSRHTPGPIKKPTVICDAHTLPFRNETFEKVYCYHTLEHLHSPFKCLTEIHRVMKDKATLHVEQPDAAKVDWELPQHNYSWNRFTLKWILLNVGFKVPGQAEPIGKQCLQIDAVKTKWKAIGHNLGVYYLDEKPVQPIHSRLKYPPRPTLVPVANVKMLDYEFTFQNMSINTVCPRMDIPNINLEALQIWIDHLGLAIYNPISAWQGPTGEIQLMTDGDHRTRCLWEIGDPYVSVMLRKSKHRTCEAKEWNDWFKWTSEIAQHNRYPPAVQTKKGFNYYPNLTATPSLLQKYYDMPEHDGPYYEETLDTTKSFREILFQLGHGRLYREAVLNQIVDDAKIKDKTILDAGCSFGYYSFLLLEEGAKWSTCVDPSDFAIQIAQTIGARRQLSLTPRCTSIQQFLKDNHEKFDVCLFLNVFHHLLAQNKEEGWRTINELLDRCGKVYLMMGTTDPDWHVIDEYGDDIDKAVSTMTGLHPNPLLKTGYRNRTLYVLSRNS